MALPIPTNDTTSYLNEILNVLLRVESELQQLNNAATQKPTVQLDVVQLADRLTVALHNANAKSAKSTKAG